MKRDCFQAVVVNGAAGCGKTTFEQFAYNFLGERNVRIRSTVDKVKEIAKFCGWDGVKDFKSRKFLSDLKDALTDFNDLPHQDVLKFFQTWQNVDQSIYGGFYKPELHILFIDSREPEDIERFKQELGAVTVLIRRAEAEAKPTSNHADANILNYNYDYVIDNNGSLKDFQKQTIDFINLLKEKNSDIIDIQKGE